MKKHIDYLTELENIRTATGCDFVAIVLVEPAENQHVLKWKYATGSISSRLKHVTLQSGKGIAGMVFKTGKPLIVHDVADFTDREDLFNYPILALEKLKSMGAYPLWHEGRVAGVLLGGFREAHKMTEQNLRSLKQSSKKRIGSLDGKELMFN